MIEYAVHGQLLAAMALLGGGGFLIEIVAGSVFAAEQTLHGQDSHLRLWLFDEG